MIDATGNVIKTVADSGILDPVGESTTATDTGTGTAPESGSPESINQPTQLISRVKQQAGLGDTSPTLPTGTEFVPVKQEVQTDELLNTDITQTAVDIDPLQASKEGLEIPVPTKTAANTYEAYTTPGTPEAVAAKGKLSAESVVGDIQGVVSQNSLVEAAQGTVSEESTVKYQLGELFSSFEEGKPPPAWAAPAVRQVGALMAQRGLGKSSMAAAAVTQAIMEAGIPIAMEDARTYATMDLTNLNNRQQAALTNAATYAAMDRANLDARMQAAVTNAQSFLAMDMANLNNEQRSSELTYQSEIQRMFNNQAAENASRQFNAQSQTQVDQFFAEMEVQVSNANANRLAAQEQFNVNEGNAMKQFVASMNDARERFETQLRVQIDQSNAQWRRDINTSNTALENEANRLNAQNLLNLSVTAQNNLWQRYRDESAWIFQMSENATQREHELGMLAMEIAENQDAYDTALRNSIAGELGKSAIRVIFG